MEQVADVRAAAKAQCLDASVTATLPNLVRDRWASLLRDDAFTVVDEDENRVVLTSPDVRIEAVSDPGGEVSVAVCRHEQESWQGWAYAGMVGRASVARLLELALEEMQADPAILRGDTAFYQALSERATADAEEWTLYAAKRGPRPGRDRPLP
jgi:hypothetical protein